MEDARRPTAGEREGDDYDGNNMLATIYDLVFAHLPLSVQAITLPALNKALREWAEEQRAKERALEEAPVVKIKKLSIAIFDVPLWAAQQRQRREPQLSDDEKRRFQLRAIAHGDVAAVGWLGVGDDYLHHTLLCAFAALGGQLEALQWLRATGCAWDAWTCSAAAAGGNPAVLQWARTNGCDWTASTCSWAACNGHLAALQWARANGCAWDSDLTCTEAARGCHLAVLQWARANGCPEH